MESDWHTRDRLPTLPSVAEMLASSSRPASDSIPIHHYQLPDAQPPVSHSSPPNMHAVPSTVTANAPVSSEQSFRLAVAPNHASHASPSESTTLASSLDRRHHQPSEFRPASLSLASALAAEVCPSLQDTEILNNNARRQDSAIAQQLFDTVKESSSLEPNALFSHRSLNDRHHSGSPRSSSYSVARSPVLSASDHLDTASAMSNVHVAHPAAPVPPRNGPDSSYTMTNPCLTSDQSTTSNTRQQRYNVRFAANHTPSNMPIAQSQRSRSSPPLRTVPASCAAIDSPSPPHNEPIVRTIEPAIQAITRSLQPSEGSLQPGGRGWEPSVERCTRCGDIWERPLPNPAKWDQDSPAENTNGFARASMNILSQIRQHGKDADHQYEQWKEKHSHCLVIEYCDRGTSPDHTNSSNSSHGTVLDGHFCAGESVQHTSNKRKSNAPHGDPPKYRKVTFSAITSSPPPVRPTAPL